MMRWRPLLLPIYIPANEQHYLLLRTYLRCVAAVHLRRDRHLIVVERQACDFRTCLLRSHIDSYQMFTLKLQTKRHGFTTYVWPGLLSDMCCKVAGHASRNCENWKFQVTD